MSRSQLGYRKKSPLVGIIERIFGQLGRLAPFSALLVRLTLGVMFAQSGWGKVQNLESTAGYFDSLDIPAPGFHAALVGNVEFVGGMLLVLGLLSRWAAFPLAITMLVAILTALLPDAEGLLDVLALSETIYLAVLLHIVSQGPGKWSLDSLLSRKFDFNIIRNERPSS